MVQDESQIKENENPDIASENSGGELRDDDQLGAATVSDEESHGHDGQGRHAAHPRYAHARPGSMTTLTRTCRFAA